METFRDPFLEEAWSRHAKAERGEEENTEELREIEIYLDLKETCEGNPVLQELLEDVEKQTLRYERSIARIARMQLEGEKREDIAGSDEARRRAHDALISDLDILARNMKKLGLDTRWRDDVGLTRDEIGLWAQYVAPHLRRIVEERHERSR